MLSPLELYQDLIKQKQFEPDANQALVIKELNRIYFDLVPRFRKTSFIARLWWRHQPPIVGLYLWGGVGIGKTWLMDLLQQSLPEGFALRMHFHEFMQHIHTELTKYQGETNPLIKVARNLAKCHGILCFDEFFVADITDAMLLAGLLKALFNEGMTLVTTSNIPPDLLYKGGVNRERFLPAINLLKQYTHVFHLPVTRDYRFRNLHHATVYYFPLNEATQAKMQQHFDTLVHQWKSESLHIKERSIPVMRVGKNVVWFDFEVLCNIPRSQVDYLEIAKSYHTVFLSNVPKLAKDDLNRTLYLINLVDVFYDAQVKLVISAACPIEELYETGRLSFEFQRTKSRLQEMQSMEYLQRPHLVQ